MKNVADMQIDFYSGNEASVRVSLSVPRERALVCEVALFCIFVLRQMNNLKGVGLDQVIAKALLQAKDSNTDLLNT